MRSIIHTKSSGIQLNIFAFSLLSMKNVSPSSLSDLLGTFVNIFFVYFPWYSHVCKYSLRVEEKCSSIWVKFRHLIHFNDMWRRPEPSSTQNFQTVGIIQNREQIPGRQFALFPLGSFFPPLKISFTILNRILLKCCYHIQK